MGEIRVNIFIAFTGAAITLLELSVKERHTAGSQLTSAVITVLLVLLVLGLMTLLRLIKRNIATDEYKAELDQIRQVLKDSVVGKGLLLGYSPFLRFVVSSPTLTDDTIVLRVFGGLLHLMAVVNSLILAGILAAALFLPLDMNVRLSPWNTSGSLIIVVGGGVAILLFQLKYNNYVHRKSKELTQTTIPTHAGGVVYRTKDGKTVYLIVRPRRGETSIWVLPKGQIEKGEEHVEAALREVLEETGTVAQPVSFIDVSEYKAAARRHAGMNNNSRTRFAALSFT